jgi:hypothetical protein
MKRKLDNPSVREARLKQILASVTGHDNAITPTHGNLVGHNVFIGFLALYFLSVAKGQSGAFRLTVI